MGFGRTRRPSTPMFAATRGAAVEEKRPNLAPLCLLPVGERRRNHTVRGARNCLFELRKLPLVLEFERVPLDLELKLVPFGKVLPLPKELPHKLLSVYPGCELLPQRRRRRP